MIRVRRTLALLVVTPLLAAGCTDWAGYDLDYLSGRTPILSTMRSSVAYDPYEMPRLPPEHSVPIAGEFGNSPAPFSMLQLDSVAATLTNPYAAGAAAEVLARGEAVYGNQCAICHGTSGAGDGAVIAPGKIMYILPVNGGTAVGRSDGYLYSIMVVGRGLMPAYGEKLSHTDRWAVVEYIRELQRANGAAVATPPAPVAAVEP